MVSWAKLSVLESFISTFTVFLKDTSGFEEEIVES